MPDSERKLSRRDFLRLSVEAAVAACFGCQPVKSAEEEAPESSPDCFLYSSEQTRTQIEELLKKAMPGKKVQTQLYPFSELQVVEDLVAAKMGKRFFSERLVQFETNRQVPVLLLPGKEEAVGQIEPGEVIGKPNFVVKTKEGCYFVLFYAQEEEKFWSQLFTPKANQLVIGGGECPLFNLYFLPAAIVGNESYFDMLISFPPEEERNPRWIEVKMAVTELPPLGSCFLSRG